MKIYSINNFGPLVYTRLSFVVVGSGSLILRGHSFTKNQQRHETNLLPDPDPGGLAP